MTPSPGPTPLARDASQWPWESSVWLHNRIRQLTRLVSNFPERAPKLPVVSLPHPGFLSASLLFGWDGMGWGPSSGSLTSQRLLWRFLPRPHHWGVWLITSLGDMSLSCQVIPVECGPRLGPRAICRPSLCRRVSSIDRDLQTPARRRVESSTGPACGPCPALPFASLPCSGWPEGMARGVGAQHA